MIPVLYGYAFDDLALVAESDSKRPRSGRTEQTIEVPATATQTRAVAIEAQTRNDEEIDLLRCDTRKPRIRLGDPAIAGRKVRMAANDMQVDAVLLDPRQNHPGDARREFIKDQLGREFASPAHVETYRLRRAQLG